MRIYFDADDTLHICAEDSTEAMALKYWKGEHAEHGAKLLEVDTEIPIRMASA